MSGVTTHAILNLPVFPGAMSLGLQGGPGQGSERLLQSHACQHSFDVYRSVKPGLGLCNAVHCSGCTPSHRLAASLAWDHQQPLTLRR